MRSLPMPFALLALLWIATCAQPSSLQTGPSENELLRNACERTLLSFASDAEPSRQIQVTLPAGLGPALRALRGTGRGRHVEALEAALERAGQQALVETGPWLLAQAERFSAAAPLAGGEDAATDAFRSTHEAALRDELAAAVERASGPAGAADALGVVRAEAARLPLPRSVDVDLVSFVTEQPANGFFAALADEEHRLREQRTLVQHERPADMSPRNEEGSR
jgi:Protein of unknown function (DUF4197)